MKRLYYLTRHIGVVDSVSKLLHEAGVTDWNFHVLSKDKAGLATHKIHSTTPLHERDLIHSSEQGAIVGGIAGLMLAGVLMATSVLPASPMGYLGFAALVLVFLLHGFWAGGLVGIQKENYKIRRFHKELEDGQYLLMIDVAAKEEVTIANLVSRYYEAKPAGKDTTLISPFGKTNLAPF